MYSKLDERENVKSNSWQTGPYLLSILRSLFLFYLFLLLPRRILEAVLGQDTNIRAVDTNTKPYG